MRSAQRRAAQFQAAAGQYILLAIQRQVVGHFAGHHLRDQAKVKSAAGHRRRGRGPLHHAAVPMRAGIFGAHDDFDQCPRRLNIDALGAIFADPLQGFAARLTGPLRLRDVNEHFHAGKVRRQLAPAVSPATAAGDNFLLGRFRQARGQILGKLLEQAALACAFDVPLAAAAIEITLE